MMWRSSPVARNAPQRKFIDDADSTPGLPLLRLLNIAGETGQPILLASRLPPARWPTIIPDLASRLRAITAVPIGPPDDTLLKLLLQRLLVARGVAIGEDLLALLLRELPRTAAMMRAAAAALDRRALAEGRKITRDIVRHVLADLAERADLDGLAGREGDRVDSDDRGG